MKKEELKPFSKRISICRVKDSKTGKAKQIKKMVKVFAKSKKEADAKFDEIKKQQRAKILKIKDQRSLAEVIVSYYEENTHFSVNTVVKRQWYRKIIEAEFGDTLVYSIEGDDIKQFLKELKDERGYGEETLRDFRRLLNDYFEFALINKYISENPMNELKKFDIGKRVNLRRIQKDLTSDDVKRVIKYIFNHKTDRSYSLELKVQILLTLEGCLRPTELYALTWNDIDLEEGSMSITKDLTVITQKDAKELNLPRISIGETKTYGSNRKIPLSNQTIRMLTAFKQESDNYIRKHKCKNTTEILFFQRRNIPKDGQVEYAYGSGLRSRLGKISKYLLPDKSNCRVHPYALRKLSDTERENAAGIPKRVTEYVMGHNGNPLDLRYVEDYYSLAKKTLPEWEKILEEIIGNKTK